LIVRHVVVTKSHPVRVQVKVSLCGIRSPKQDRARGGDCPACVRIVKRGK